MINSSDRSNSSTGVCASGKTGHRQSGVQDAVAWIKQYPGIDGYTVAWLHAGGQLRIDQGMYYFEGETKGLDIPRFSQALKIQVRVTEAAKRGLIVSTTRLINRRVSGVNNEGVSFVNHIKSTGYKVAGDADPVLPIAQPIDDGNTGDDGGGTGGTVRGMPKGFMDRLFGSDE